MQILEAVETLTLREQFRLIEIAHETNDSEIRRRALGLLSHYLDAPLMINNPQILAGIKVAG